ncbi:MAG: TonB-dependent receptor [Tannerella sp.]|jgi:TonB-linked SusC/RagA family outer membrane protein|nr:TonB-dependent receptor [Tannerella sp.]
MKIKFNNQHVQMMNYLFLLLKKIPLYMKLILVLISLSFSLMHAASTYGQSAMLSLNITNMPVQNVLDEIENQSEFSFFYNNKQLNTKRMVTLKKQNADIFMVLDELFADTNITYSVLDKSIILTAKEGTMPALQQSGKRITGVVTDEKGEPVIGANIVEKGTTNGTVTDIEGNFSLQIPSDAILQISYIGYLPLEVQVGNQTNLQIALREDTKALDEVVIIAYGTQKARSVTGAMSKMNTEELADMPVANIGQKLQGKFSGVQIYQANGEPMAGMALRIRGQASLNGGHSPLVVIDGFPSSTGLEQLTPDEIENITVLKDAASAALYGSRAANGVILVTTKGAKEGKTHIEFSTYFGVTHVPRKGMPDVMNAREFAQFKKEYYEDQAIYEGYTGGVPEVYQNPQSLGNGTDWFDVLLRDAITQNYNLSLTAGTSKVKSAINLNYSKQEGVILNTYSERMSARANNVFHATRKITFGLNVSGSYQMGQLTESLGGGRYIIGSAFLMDPQLKYKNDDGSYPVSYTQPGMFANPNYYLVLTEQKHPLKYLRGIVNAYMNVEFVDGLQYRLSANADLGSEIKERWVPSVANGTMFSAPPKPATGWHQNRNYTNWLIENTLTYQKTIAEKHHLDLLAGYTTQKSWEDQAMIQADNFPDDEVSWWGAASNRVGYLSNERSHVYEWSMISYLGRLNYDFDGKYLLSLSFRRDGCSRFGSNSKWANFPSVSLGWIISDESFMESLDWMSYLKLRGSYGKVGNYNIGNYRYLSSAVSTNYVFGGGIAAGRSLNGIGNNNLTWETTQQNDLGVDVGLFNDRLFLVYDYYWKKTDGLLYQIDIPRQAGFSAIYSNIGELRFWGHEIGVETKNMVGDFKWNTNLNMTFNKNKAVKLGTNDRHIGGDSNQEDYNRTEVGQPLGQFYGYIYDGVFMTEEEYQKGPKHASSMVGTVRMKDLNNDGVIDMSDRTFIGDPNPDVLFGITNEFSYKNFDASLVLAGSIGGDIIDGTLEWTENIDGVFNVTKEIAERWRSPENPGNGKIPRTRTGTTELFRYNNTRWVFDGSYISVKNLTVGYTIPVKSNNYINGLRVYFSGQNMLTLTRYPGMNPEVNNHGTEGIRQGVDISSYPVAAIYTLGVNIKF